MSLTSQIITLSSLTQHSGIVKDNTLVEHHHREGQLVDHKPNNPQETPHTRCHLLPIRDFYPNKENKQA